MRNSFFPHFSTAILVATAVLTLQACRSHLDADPEVRQEQIRQRNELREAKRQARLHEKQEVHREVYGYYELKSVPEGKSKLVMRTDARPYRVEFSICASPAAGCEDVGKVTKTPYTATWALKKAVSVDKALFNLDPFLVRTLEPGQRTLISAYGSYSNSYGWGRCGYVKALITPEENHAYLVEYKLENGKCFLDAYDATDPDHPVLLDKTEKPSEPKMEENTPKPSDENNPPPSEDAS